MSFDCFAWPLFCCTWPACYVFVSPFFFGMLFLACAQLLWMRTGNIDWWNNHSNSDLSSPPNNPILGLVKDVARESAVQFIIILIWYSQKIQRSGRPAKVGYWQIGYHLLSVHVRSKSRVVCVCGCFPVAVYLYIFGKDPLSILAFHYCVWDWDAANTYDY